jgi:hypothetical protein
LRYSGRTESFTCSAIPLRMVALAILRSPKHSFLFYRCFGGSDLEGMPCPQRPLSKRLGSRYRSGRSPDWLKFKNPDAPAVKREAEEDWAQ